MFKAERIEAEIVKVEAVMFTNRPGISSEIMSSD